MPRGWFSGPGIGVLDTRYLRLDCVNDPLTAGLEINAATAAEPVLILQTTDDDATNPILEVQSSGGAMLSEIEKDGNLNFTTGLADNPGIIEINDTRFFHTYGTGNLFIGPSAGNFTMAGWQHNIGIGENVLQDLTTGNSNICIGNDSGMNITSGYANVCIGYASGDAITTGQQNVLIGDYAGTRITTGQENFCIGSQAGEDITTASYNMLLGRTAGANITTGHSNVGVGAAALNVLIIGIANVAIGASALNQAVGSRNIGIGQAAGYQALGDYNVLIGDGASQELQAGDYNVCIGYRAGFGVAATSAYTQNTVIGVNAGWALTTGSYNVLLGLQAGDVITTGAYNIIIGYNIDPTAAGVSSELNIGALIYGDLAHEKGGVNVTPPNLTATWHVDQPTSDAAIPVLLLDQADIDQDMIEFVCAIGVGNAIEAVGAKVLTTTHFIKVTLPGGLTRYFPVGTIA